MLACGWQHALMPALLGCSSAVPRSPLYMLQSLSAFVSCHCNHPKKKLFIGANLLQPMTGARCTLWWVRWRCKTGLKKILWSSFLSLASALAQRCCRKDGKVPLLRPVGPTVPPTPETLWVLAAACETQQIREAFCSDSAESVHSSSVVSFHKQNKTL